MGTRLDRLRDALQRAEVEALLVSKPANIRYLCGATGTACELLVTADDAALFSSFVDITQNAETARDVIHVRRTQGPTDVAARIGGLRQIGLEAHVLPYASYAAYQAAMPEVQVVPTTGIVEQLRWVKDETELALIERAMAINDLGIQYARAHLHAGITELGGIQRLLRSRCRSRYQ
jgi:Xaa-Pro aminopeptidase